MEKAGLGGQEGKFEGRGEDCEASGCGAACQCRLLIVTRQCAPAEAVVQWHLCYVN